MSWREHRLPVVGLFQVTGHSETIGCIRAVDDMLDTDQAPLFNGNHQVVDST